MKTTTTGTCRCECGEATSTKANYRPGHDARHISKLLGSLENDVQGGKKITGREITSLAKQLPSEALQSKFTRAAHRLLAEVATDTKEAAK